MAGALGPFLPPAYFYRPFTHFALIACRMVKIAMQDGISDASAIGFCPFSGLFSGPVFPPLR